VKYVYILQSENDLDRFYTGSVTDLKDVLKNIMMEIQFILINTNHEN